MTTWHLIFQEDQLPISVGRADGVQQAPPPGLVRYIELAHGAWTLEPATKPIGMEGVEWPKPCVWTAVTGCTGAMSYVEHVKKPIVMAGEVIHPAGWQCDSCGCEEVSGFSTLTLEWDEPS